VTLGQHGLALGLVLLDVLVRGERLRQLVPVPLLRAMAINTSGDALAAITPARVGGEPLRFVALQRSGASAATLLAAFATELLADTVWMVLGLLVLALAFARQAAVLWQRIAHMVTAPGIIWFGAAAIAAIVVVRLAWQSGRLPAPVVTSLADGWRIIWTRPFPVVVRVLALTFVSLAARIAILPVLASSVPGVSIPDVIAGSFALQLAQALAPTPGGAGAVELGFMAGFAQAASAAQVTGLLVTWRVYTLALGAIAGGLLILRAGWLRRASTLFETPPTASC